MKQSIGVRSIKKQGGVAAIWMGLSLVPIMGFTFWAVEGTRYVQEKSRLGDAAEAAAIAVTMADQEGSANEFATKYVNAYVRDIKSSQVTAKRKYQEAIPDSDTLEFIQYTVDVKTTHDSWFSSTFIPSFNETQDLTGQSVAKKYPAYLGDNNIDIVFVSDFSGSMNWQWGGGRTYKIDDLKKAVNTISEKLLCVDIQTKPDGTKKCADKEQDDLADKLNNRISVVPFNIRVRHRNTNGNAFSTSQLRYLSNVDTSVSPKSFEKVDWDLWREYYAWQVYDCAQDKESCPSIGSRTKKNLHRQSKRIISVLNITWGKRNEYCGWEWDRNAQETIWVCDWRSYNTNVYHLDRYRYVDYAKSVDQMLVDKYGTYKFHYQTDTNNRLYSGFGNKNNVQFYNVALTNKLSDVNAIKGMSANGSTAVFQGVIKGVQELNDGKPTNDDELETYKTKVKMMLILSDGQETPESNIFPMLVDSGLCDEARELIPGLYIGVIGIDFKASLQSGFQDCVVDADEDIIDVSNLDELIEKIEELIRKGSKTSGTTKLY
ncbi:pilus assembly protein TadG-related protein [Vibrio sp. 10N.261.51.F12]